MQEETSLTKVIGHSVFTLSFFFFYINFNLSFLIRKPKLSLPLHPIKSEGERLIYLKGICSRYILRSARCTLDLNGHTER